MGYVGIDYGRIGGTNRNAETGIHYGVISQHSVGQVWYDEAETDYGEPTCPECGNTAVEYDSDAHGDYAPDTHHCVDYACGHCEYAFDSSEAYGDEPNGYSYEGEGYKLVDCLDSDIMVLESPYYTFAQFCSPCVPGAGNLDSAMEEGVKTYCLGHDWFDGGKAPYPVYSVATGETVDG